MVEENNHNKPTHPLSAKKKQDESYQTIYQKELGYLNDANNESLIAAKRHNRNPQNNVALGIVPVNDLNGFSKHDESRKFIDKITFEQAYDSRNENNYPIRGRVILT